MSFPRYQNYKPSGVEWLGEVPAHWGAGQSRRLFALRNERSVDTDKQLTASQEHGVIYQEDFIRLEGRRVVEVIKGADILKHVEPNDFVISMRSFQGGIEWCRLRGCISSAYVMLVPCDRIHGPFFAFLLKSQSYIQALQTTSNLVRDGQALRYENFTKVDLPLVPMNEQRVIAEFLDRETVKIDELVAEQRRLMELLKEKRQAVISHAVTRGLNPKALLKPSGIEWLGDVPAHWIVAKTSRHFKIAMGQTILKEDLVEDGDWPVFSATDGDQYFGRVNDPQVRLDIGDIVIPARGNCIGAVKLVKEPATTTQTTIYCKNRSQELLPRFVYQYLRGRKDHLFYFTRTAIPQITVEEVSSNRILIPPLGEQDEIAKHLENQSAKFDTLTAEAQRAIDLLLERRTALISAAVTGQIDVRGFASADEDLRMVAEAQAPYGAT